MRENNDMELLMQRKMEEFLLEPAPSDWQAIYEQLHPKKKRRFFWWWFPLAAGLSLFGAYWLFNSSPKDTIPQAASNPMISEQLIKTPIDNTKSGTSTSESSAPSVNTPTSALKTIAQIPAPEQNREERTTISKERSASPAQTIQPERKTDSRPPTASTMPTEPIEFNNQSGKEAAPDYQAVGTSKPEPAASETAPQPAISPASVEQFEATQPADPNPTSAQTTVTETPAAATKKAIPNLSNHKQKGWYLGVYGGIGANMPTQAISMAKSADFNSSPGPSSSYSSTRNAERNGVHVSLGIAIERKMKKMSFTTGIGIQQNTWGSDLTIYRDSISTAGYYSRTVVSQNTINYRHLAIEIPMILNFRIAGKKSSTYWINAGLNNTISLALQKRTDGTIANNTVYLIPSEPTSYQPQIRFGLMYENARQKSHWQASPFMQYSLSNMTRSGTPDARLLHFGVMGRYFFKRL